MRLPSTQHQHAVAAQMHGWYIFPCEPGEKMGALLEPGKPWRIKWYEAATNDLDMITRLWRDTNPAYNIGVSCKKSGLLVVDCDVPKNWSATEDGWDQFKSLCERRGASWEETIDTYQVETPSYGLHLYYTWPEDVQASQASLDSLLDVRSNGGEKGGYVLGAGSVTPQGWYHCVNPAPIRPTPRWLMDEVTLKPTTYLTGGSSEPFTRAYGVSLAGLHTFLRNATEGRRNDSLFWVVAQAAEENPHLEEDDLLNEFWNDAVSVGLTPQEISASVRSGIRKGRR